MDPWGKLADTGVIVTYLWSPAPSLVLAAVTFHRVTLGVACTGPALPPAFLCRCWGPGLGGKLLMGMVCPDTLFQRAWV